MNSDHSEEEFLTLAADCQVSIEAGLERIGRKMTDFQSILDWGAGCGRIMRQWSNLFDSARFCGSDIDSTMIKWDRKHLPGVEWQTNHADPPLPWPPDTFDLIYGASVFTHLDSERRLKWSEELVRVSRPDAIVMLSTQGPFAFDYSLRSTATPEQLRSFDVDGYLFIKNITDGVLPEWYQTTFQRFERQECGLVKELDQSVHIPQGMTGYQDLTIFQVRK